MEILSYFLLIFYIRKFMCVGMNDCYYDVHTFVPILKKIRIEMLAYAMD